jgi:hypothetical protein
VDLQQKIQNSTPQRRTIPISGLSL